MAVNPSVPALLHCVDVNAFKGIVKVKPSALGHSLNLNSCVIEGLINLVLDSVP
jgi:hypothetical protein